MRLEARTERSEVPAKHPKPLLLRMHSRRIRRAPVACPIAFRAAHVRIDDARNRGGASLHQLHASLVPGDVKIRIIQRLFYRRERATLALHHGKVRQPLHFQDLSDVHLRHSLQPGHDVSVVVREVGMIVPRELRFGVHDRARLDPLAKAERDLDWALAVLARRGEDVCVARAQELPAIPPAYPSRRDDVADTPNVGSRELHLLVAAHPAFKRADVPPVLVHVPLADQASPCLARSKAGAELIRTQHLEHADESVISEVGERRSVVGRGSGPRGDHGACRKCRSRSR